VDNGWFNPSVAGIGEHTIVYSYTSPDGCEDSDEQIAVVTSCVGISENEEGIFSIYPNPSSDKVTIETQEMGEILVKVVNLLGEKVMESKFSSANPLILFNLNPGIYTVEFLVDGKTFNRKLIITDK
jgi:hypothetical protein